MKTKTLFTILFTLFAFSISYASFPVERTSTTANNTEISENIEHTALISPASAAGQDKVVGVLLWFFLGGLAAHRWYYKKPVGWNILFILTLGGLGVWWIIDLINMLSDNF